MPHCVTGAVLRQRTGLSLRSAVAALSDEAWKAAIQALWDTGVGASAAADWGTARAMVNTFMVATGGSGAKASVLLDPLVVILFGDASTGRVDSVITSDIAWML